MRGGVANTDVKHDNVSFQKVFHFNRTFDIEAKKTRIKKQLCVNGYVTAHSSVTGYGRKTGLSGTMYVIFTLLKNMLYLSIAKWCLFYIYLYFDFLVTGCCRDK